MVLDLLLSLSLISLIHCRLTFDGAELLDQSDLQHITTTPLSCPNGCFSPSHTPFVKVIDDKGVEIISIADISSSADTTGFKLSPGDYALKKIDYDYEFTIYVVQKDAGSDAIQCNTIFSSRIRMIN
ncbi:hypothetical protein PRIPAC_95746 [Pristionchus pacificus]|uniref:Uncharacterized protein n=1 Tax=Pristionchus pacificus TaxID=54126 RepID=A0A2A6D212_PRIPA|nr:hypothetical protein PRIPAC_95746 [Pristionchus pacificus]|eukprot:PDM84420.1 hypothetical protein PRIPAC_33443 [Pristionchus pacificus]